jgi:hypothetical protein
MMLVACNAGSSSPLHTAPNPTEYRNRFRLTEETA